MSLRQLLLRAIEALPKTLDDCDAQKRCEDELIAAIVQPAPYHTLYPRHEQEALLRDGLKAYRTSEFRHAMRRHVEILRQGMS